jgi:hypothetical protein
MYTDPVQQRNQRCADRENRQHLWQASQGLQTQGQWVSLAPEPGTWALELATCNERHGMPKLIPLPFGCTIRFSSLQAESMQANWWPGETLGTQYVWLGRSLVGVSYVGGVCYSGSSTRAAPPFPELSKWHAEIKWVYHGNGGHGLWVTDGCTRPRQPSTFGTSVDGILISQAEGVSPQQRSYIQFGVPHLMPGPPYPDAHQFVYQLIKTPAFINLTL